MTSVKLSVMEKEGTEVKLSVQTTARLEVSEIQSEQGLHILDVEAIAITEGLWNNFVFTEEVIHAAVPMFKGRAVMEEHQLDDGAVGTIMNAQTIPGGVKSRFILFNERSINAVLSGEKRAVSIHFLVDGQFAKDSEDVFQITEVKKMLEMSIVADPGCEEALILATRESTIELSKTNEVETMSDDNVPSDDGKRESLETELAAVQSEKERIEAELSKERDSLKQEVARLKAEHRVQMAKSVASTLIAEGKLAPASEELFTLLHSRFSDDGDREALEMLLKQQVSLVSSGQIAESDETPPPAEPEVELSVDDLTEQILMESLTKERMMQAMGGI